MELLPTQEEFVFSKAKFPAFVGGFGSGKTEALVNRAILGKMQYPGQDRGYFAPTYSLLELTAFPRFEALCDKYEIQAKLNVGKKLMTFRGAGKIIFKTLEVPDRIVGFEIADADIDELDTLPTAKASNAFNKVIARCRQTKPGHAPNTCSVGTTPEGYRFVYEQWQKKSLPSYQLYRAKTRENYMLPDGYVDSLHETYPPQLLAAYLDGEFVNMVSGSVYPEFNRVLNGTKEVMQAGEGLHIGLDFNVYNMTAIVHVIRDGLPIAVDEMTQGRDTSSMAEQIKDRYPNRSIVIYPDASGGSHKSVNASVSDLSILRGKGFTVSSDLTNPRVRDRVNSMNAMILNGAGERRYKVNTQKCPVLTESLEKQAYDKNGAPDKSSNMDHANDAAGYFMVKRFGIVKPVTSINLRTAM